MTHPLVLGVSDATLGGALAIGWVFVLGAGLYQYRRGIRSREWFYMTATVGGFSLAFGLIQVSTTLAGIGESGALVLAVGSFCAGIATGIQWWRIRTATAEQAVKA